MKLHHPIPFSILTAATALALTAWTIGIDQRMSVDREFSRLLNASPRQVVEATEAGMVIPPRARSRSRFADILTQELFPPPYDRALEEVEYALVLHPLDSSLWVQAARFQMFRGNLQEARAALNVSDQIDPRYPTQRIEAIRLWGLLGDSDRAKAIANNVARLGSPFRESAAGELAAIGVPPREIFSLVSEPGLDSEQLFNLTRSIIESDSSRVEETIRELPAEVVREPDFRRRLAVLLERTRRFHILLSVWEMDGAELEEVLPGLFVDNTDLSLPSRAGVFPLGWRVPENVSGVSTRWESASGGANPSAGRIEVNFGLEADRRVQWPFYRTVLPAQTPVIITLRIRQEPSYGGTLTFRARTPHNLIHGPTTDPRVGGWTDLTLTMPAQPRPEILNLELEWQRRGFDMEGQGTLLLIDGVTFRSPSEAPNP